MIANWYYNAMCNFFTAFLPQSPQRLRKERKDLSLRTLRNLCALCGSEKVAHQVIRPLSKVNFYPIKSMGQIPVLKEVYYKCKNSRFPGFSGMKAFTAKSDGICLRFFFKAFFYISPATFCRTKTASSTEITLFWLTSAFTATL